MEISKIEPVPRVGVGVAVIKNGKILLGKRKGSHSAGEWAPPGGHLDFGETVEACAYRELLEETSLKANSIKLGSWVENIFDEKKHYITIFVSVNEFEGEPQVLEPEKCETWKWFSLDDLPSPLFPCFVSMLLKTGRDLV